MINLRENYVAGLRLARYPWIRSQTRRRLRYGAKDVKMFVPIIQSLLFSEKAT